MKWLVQCPFYDSVLEEILSLKHCTLDTWSVRAICVYLQCKLDYALLCCYTPLFNPSASSPLNSPLNHITKIVSITQQFVGMVSKTFLKLLISLPSVDKIRPVSVVQTAYFHCASSILRLDWQTVFAA
jgi:hypothetical protein